MEVGIRGAIKHSNTRLHGRSDQLLLPPNVYITSSEVILLIRLRSAGFYILLWSAFSGN